MGIIEEIKEAANLAREAGNLPLYEKLLDFQQRLQDLTRENWRLARRVEELEEKLAFQGEMAFDAGVYWHRPVEGDHEGPFCPRCWDVDRLAVHLRDAHDGYFRCPHCDKVFESGAPGRGGATVWHGR